MKSRHEVFPSILDNDLYKFTMQHAVLQHYKDAKAVYQFTNRDKDLQLNAEAVAWLDKQIKDMANLELTPEEREYIASFDFFDESYANYLAKFRYRPEEQVQYKFDPETRDFELEITGLWHETILYEVPLLALISEAYFKFVDRDWNYDGQYEKALDKGVKLLENGCKFSEFGTRRRRDYKTQDIVVHALDEAAEKCKDAKGVFSGSSNVYLAKKYGTPAIGTVAHEFFMAISALEGVEHANGIALQRWYDTYKGALGIALTDTFTTDVFLRDFNHDLATKYAAVRQDSGDPVEFLQRMVDHYKSVDVDPKNKFIVFSDALDVPKAIKLQKAAHEAGIGASFGIGTSLTNDFTKVSNPEQKSTPMNMVIKMKYCNGQRVIKLSDDVLKHSASDDLVDELKKKLGI
ncbi:nicotinate phosphoribosyltransferase [Zychaea mexicana]|uniref:nicotinate phosphoribosyltransferase n=1 Tax=Zychaea mexicana TaxID=64656 RepID=UPI0022FDFB1C|nr:nicotinate phosphoribosyltransferase [Zychaea mexicana]KAI9492024.1 nicotinate phosphoribosyltransferase [Zychaea mexicana]